MKDKSYNANGFTTLLAVTVFVIFINLLIPLLRTYFDTSLITLMELILFILQPILFILAVIFVIRNFNRNCLVAIIPLCIIIVGFFLWITAHRTLVGPRINHYFFKTQRLQVVDQVKLNTLQFHLDSIKQFKYISLPAKYKNATTTKQIAVSENNNNLMVYFYMYRSLIGQEGYVYSASDIPPKDGAFGWDYVSQKKLGKNWYWVVFD